MPDLNAIRSISISLTEDAAWCRVCRDRSGSARCSPPPRGGGGGGGHTGRVQAGSAQVQLVGSPQFGQQDLMQAMPDAGGLPVAQPAPTGHAAAVAQIQGKFFPWDAGTQDIDDAVEGLLIADARPPSFGRRRY